ncbi:MAG: hypothetical protein HY426_01785 [Candidatus Levybacteria bacterium]|nr:hypothetical protein [Candidatus Levybacteria bacterium]
MIIDFLASLSFYFLPYLTGRFFSKNPIQSWMLGALSWLALFFLVSSLINLVGHGDFSSIIRILAVTIALLSGINLARTSFKDIKRVQIENLTIPFFLILFGSLVYFLIWKRNTPYPLQLNWDIYEHITLANLISKGNLSFFTSQISDTFTFNSYSPIFGILLSIPKIIFQKSLIGIYFWLEYWHYLLTILASFLIARKIFQEKWMGLLAAAVSALVFESIMVYSNLFFIPQTLVALLSVFVYLNMEKHKPIWLLIAFTTIFLMHYVIGILSIVVLIFVYLSKRFGLSEKVLNIGILSSTLLLLSSIGISFLGKWHLLPIEEAQHFNFSFMEKLGFFTNWYGLMFFIFSAVGYLVITRSKKTDLKLVLIIALLIMALSLAPFSYFLKFHVLGRYFINLILVVGMGAFLINLPKIIRTAGILFIGLVLLITFYKNQLIYKEPLHFKNYETQISFDEIAAGEWLASYTEGERTFLITDPSLSYILEAISGVNTQGGAYMSLESRKILSDLRNTNDSALLKIELLRIRDQLDQDREEVLFVLGGRYFEWQRLSESEKQSSFYNIWSPKLTRDQDKSYIEFIKNSPEFEAIYENDQLVIFRLI